MIPHSIRRINLRDHSFPISSLGTSSSSSSSSWPSDSRINNSISGSNSSSLILNSSLSSTLMFSPPNISNDFNSFGILDSNGLPNSNGGNSPFILQKRFKVKKSRIGGQQHHMFGPCRPKGRFYYAFHKQIGKSANWHKYMERYIAPKKREMEMRYIFLHCTLYVSSCCILFIVFDNNHSHDFYLFFYLFVFPKFCYISSCSRKKVAVLMFPISAISVLVSQTFLVEAGSRTIRDTKRGTI